MKGGFFLNVVVREGVIIFKLFVSKDKMLLVGWDIFFVLDFCFDVVDGVGRFYFKGDGFVG